MLLSVEKTISLNGPQTSIMKKLREDTGTENLASDAAQARRTVAAGDARYSPTTMRVVLSVLRKVYPENQLFIDEMAKRKALFAAIDESQQATARQKEQFISFDDIVAFRKAKMSVMTPEEKLLISLYTMIPPVRLDYTPMLIVARKPRKLAEGMNYLIVRSSSIDVLFASYKTARTYGVKQFALPAALTAVIREYLAAKPDNTFLLQDDSGTPYSPARLGATVQRIFQKYLEKDTGVIMIRHAFATKFHTGQKPLKDLKGLAEKMLHSPMTSQAYRFVDLE